MASGSSCEGRCLSRTPCTRFSQADEDCTCDRCADGPEYEQTHDCAENCRPQKCTNYEICSASAPEHILKLKNGLCDNCHWFLISNPLATYTKSEGKPCRLCKRTDRIFVFERCRHSVCFLCQTFTLESKRKVDLSFCEKCEDNYRKKNPNWDLEY